MMIQHDLTGQWQMREMLMGTWIAGQYSGISHQRFAGKRQNR